MVASFVLAITPGPGVVYVVTRSISYGVRSGLLSVFLRFAAGNVGNVVRS